MVKLSRPLGKVLGLPLSVLSYFDCLVAIANRVGLHTHALGRQAQQVVQCAS